jgi:hypothetical protein
LSLKAQNFDFGSRSFPFKTAIAEIRSAVVLVKSGAELVSDVAFLFFLSIFAPGLAVLVAGGGGFALYNGISSNVKSLIDIFSNAIGTVTSIALIRRG